MPDLPVAFTTLISSNLVPVGVANMKSLRGMWIVLGLVLAMAGCAARQIYFVPD